VDGAQLAGPVQPRQLARVAPVGLDPLAATDRDQGWGNNCAVDLELREPPREHEAGRPRLVADAQFGPGMGLPELGKDLLQRVQVVGDGAVKAHFAAAAAFGRGDGDAFGVDIKSKEQ
jgi:hypothetical protein